MALDLRDDKQFFVDHPGAVPITTAQVKFLILHIVDSGSGRFASAPYGLTTFLSMAMFLSHFQG